MAGREVSHFFNIKNSCQMQLFIIFVATKITKNMDYIKSLLNLKSSNSSTRAALLLSAVVGALLALMLGVMLIIDVTKDGKVDTSLSEAGIYLGCIGAFMFAGGINKVLSEKVKSNDNNNTEE